MRKIGYSAYSVFMLILSVVLLIIWFVVFKHIPLGKMHSGSNSFFILFFPLSILLEFYIKIQILFKSDFSYKRTLLFLVAYNAINLFLLICGCGDETSTGWKICFLSMTLSMSIPDLILAVKLLKDRAKEIKRAEEAGRRNKTL